MTHDQLLRRLEPEFKRYLLRHNRVALSGHRRSPPIQDGSSQAP
eukprot:CAMPEP_0174761654 /NCGR_PEP_ID=MMETSP1094-20130205/109383_2 /TAXON_ID=156173 /ORGANISM="Chrysochromulina brevifilum, Strain UTEX LB 985" /LENGTH=43 /DNA_ID= /DNA_START= /DNA_END= /DNA_ORIENTATION=